MKPPIKKYRKTESNVGVEKILYLFRGPCGCGKTYIRKQMLSLPACGMDMADFCGTTIPERVYGAAAFVEKHDDQPCIWIEGIFAPDSPSMIALADACRRKGRAIQHIVAFTDANTADIRIERSTAPTNMQGRKELAAKYHQPFARAIGQ